MVTYKEPLYVWAWLNTALKKEWQKYAATPVTPDMLPGHELAQAWGYVVAGYSLVEQGLKAVADRVAVPQDEELPERRPGSGRVDDHAVARLQFGRHGVALRLEDAHPRRVCVALVEQERFGKAPQGALCGAAYASAMVSAPALALTVISGIETRELRRGGWRRVRGWGARTGRVS